MIAACVAASSLPGNAACLACQYAKLSPRPIMVVQSYRLCLLAAFSSRLPAAASSVAHKLDKACSCLGAPCVCFLCSLRVLPRVTRWGCYRSYERPTSSSCTAPLVPSRHTSLVGSGNTSNRAIQEALNSVCTDVQCVNASHPVSRSCGSTWTLCTR